MNRYAYALNNPLKYTDPTGHCTFQGQFNGTCLEQAKAIVLHPQTSWQEKAIATAYMTTSHAVGGVLALVGYVGLTAVAGTGAVAASTTSGAAATTNLAYQTALEGGRHSGLIQTFSNKSAAQIQRGINSLTKAANLHLDKIADPAKYADKWDDMTEQQQAGLLRFWQKEVANYKEQADVLRGILEDVTRRP